MDGPRRRVTRIPALLVFAAIPLIPDPPAPVERLPALDLERVRSAECEYRGITASFDEVTRAYALTAFDNPRLQGWQARPNPASPETEALVTATFLVDGVRPPEDGTEIPDLRRDIGETLRVTWRLNTLAAIRVNPFDDYARDALDSFRGTVDGMLQRMVYLARPAGLRAAPGAADSTRLEIATVLLREDGDPGSRGDGWTRVRVPADTLAGWVRSDLLRPVHGND